ncbi:MAG: hypothetical protein CL875_00035 [Dehalococcoidales bacterium]|jgi:hypothetical protein|nr:hypothetical protein [Dehalococcoidales bacterium]
MRTKFWFLAIAPIVAAAAVLFLTLGTDQTQDAIKADLDKKTSAPPVQQIGDSAYGQPSDSSLRVAIAGVRPQLRLWSTIRNF